MKEKIKTFLLGIVVLFVFLIFPMFTEDFVFYEKHNFLLKIAMIILCVSIIMIFIKNYIKKDSKNNTIKCKMCGNLTHNYKLFVTPNGEYIQCDICNSKYKKED